ncbi:MAG: TagF domain-containing protein [Syntrophobacteraceae bacterium]
MKKWQWVICGKHPGFKDYFQLGPNLPMVAALAEWIEKGYREVGRAKSSPAELLSWRFWAGGPERDAILFGIIRDSTDSVGRPYPLLVAGSGFLENWGAGWDGIPEACEQSWSQMESLSARIFRSVEQLEDELLRVREPEPRWTKPTRISERTAVTNSDTDEANAAGCSDSIESRASAMAKDIDIFVSLDETPSMDPYTILHLWHSFLKKHHNEPPKVVFMGGNAGSSHLAFFRRALTNRDFIRLWSV